MSYFTFSLANWPALHAAARQAAVLAYPDFLAAYFHPRRALEGLVHWLFKLEATIATQPHRG